jgi:N-acetylglucosaminyldiphosphoundecaprenol N-acetyl-beta-D-mannosaminyltransferase
VQFFIGSVAIKVNLSSLAQLEDAVQGRFDAGQGFALATLNLDHLAKLRDDPEFCRAYMAQDMVTADGNPIVWMARLAGQDLDLLPGSDLILPLTRLAVAADVPVGLMGSTTASLDLAARSLQQAVPGVRIVAKLAPPMGFDPQSAVADALLDQLNAAGVRLCFVALGAPKQEVFAARGRSRTPEIGFASIGAGLDFLSGSQTRAPAWVRRLALEWLWRMVSDPRRLAGRYWRAALVLPGHALASWRQRQR